MLRGAHFNKPWLTGELQLDAGQDILIPKTQKILLDQSAQFELESGLYSAPQVYTVSTIY